MSEPRPERPSGERIPGEPAGRDSRQDDPGAHLPDIDAAEGRADPAAAVSMRTKILAVAALAAVLGGSLLFLLASFRGSGDTTLDEERSGAMTETVSTEPSPEAAPARPARGVPLPMTASDSVSLPPPPEAGDPTAPENAPRPGTGAEPSSATATGAGGPDTAPQPRDRSPSAEEGAAAMAAVDEDEGAAAPAPDDQALTDALHELSALRAVLEKRVGGLEEAVRALASRMTELERAVPGREAADGLKKRLGAMEASLRRLDRRSLENRRMLRGDAGARRRGRELPFRLEAIDWWDGAPSVALSAGGQRRFISPGDSLAGWTLVSVNAATGEARFSRNGRQAILEVSQ